MHSNQIQNNIYQWASNSDFSAPYGVLSGSHVNKNGKKFLSVTFGRARTLDVTVEIYNKNFLLVRTNLHGNRTFRDVVQMQQFLSTL
jgi:hypothetical protein